MATFLIASNSSGTWTRLIAELSYRGAGRTLTEREYDAEIERIEMAKKLKEMNENSDKEGDMLGKAADDDPLITAIKARYKDNKEGRMHSVFYLLQEVEDEEEVAGHIDLAERIQVEKEKEIGKIVETGHSDSVVQL